MSSISRYLAPAAAIVFAFIALCFVLGRWNEAHRSQYSNVAASPGPPRPEATPRSSPLPVEGDAPWALSALPECFRQMRATAGTPSFVGAFKRELLDSHARRVAAGTLHVGDCTLRIRGDSALVERGDNRLIVSPASTLYVKGAALILDRVARGREDLRTYEPAPGTTFQWLSQVQPTTDGVGSH